jgi:hypothetical protein
LSIVHQGVRYEHPTELPAGTKVIWETADDGNTIKRQYLRFPDGSTHELVPPRDEVTF